MTSVPSWDSRSSGRGEPTLESFPLTSTRGHCDTYLHLSMHTVKSGEAAHFCSPSTEEQEGGEPGVKDHLLMTYWVWGQPELHGTLSQNTKQQQQKDSCFTGRWQNTVLKSYIWFLIGTINRNGVCPTKPWKVPQDTGSEEWSPKTEKGKYGRIWNPGC